MRIAIYKVSKRIINDISSTWLRFMMIFVNVNDIDNYKDKKVTIKAKFKIFI